MTAENFKEGDIFRWRWTDEVAERKRQYGGPSNIYWCKSRIAVFQKGRLSDTYWSSASDCHLDPADIVLEFEGNMTEMQTILAGESVFYRPDDLVDMNHPNNSRAPVFLKPGKGRDAEVMKEYFVYKAETFASDISWTERRIEECKAALAEIERGNLDNSFPTYS